MTTSRCLTPARLRLTIGIVVPLMSCSEHLPVQPSSDPGISFAVAIVNGDQQLSQVGTKLPQPLRVRVTDNSKQRFPVPNEAVNFVVTSVGGGSVFAPTVTTDVNGVGQDVWTLGPRAGQDTLEARVVDSTTGNLYSVVRFTATARAGPAASLGVQAGNNQSAQAGTVVATPVAVQLVDQFGNLDSVSNVQVTFKVVSGGGSINGQPTQTVATDARGIATLPGWKLGQPPGANTLVAIALAGQVTFSAAGTAGAPAQLSAIGSTSLGTFTVGTSLSLALAPTVRVVDNTGNGVPNVALSFTPSNSGTLNGFASVSTVTDANGIATAGIWTLGTTAGTNTVFAKASPLPNSPITFTATGVAGPAALLAPVAGDGQSAPIAQPVAIKPQARVTDRFGNPVAGVAVVFAVQSGGGSVSGANQMTDANGLATVGSWTLGASVGTNTLAASVPGSLSAITFTATATATGPAGLSIGNSAGDGQRAPAGSPLPINPAVQVTDQTGHPVAGVIVTFSVTAGGGSITGATRATDSNGIATVGSWKLGPAPGVNELQAMFDTGVSKGYTIFVATGN
jgi:adhesin/invasin